MLPYFLTYLCPMADPVGRNRERDQVATFLAAAASAPAVLTIEGEAGIGKTTLCSYCLDQARDSEALILACHPSAAESAMSFAGLTDLLAGVEDPALAGLPAPQRHALAVAALREEPSGQPPSERAIGTALNTLVTQLAASRPVVIVVDDAHWLDRATAEVIGFALRRIVDVPVGVLISRRSGVIGGLSPSDVIPDAAWRDAVKLEAMSPAALFHVVRAELGITLPRPVLVRIAEASRGNPYIAVELARAGVGSDSAIPETLHDLSVTRLSQLAPKTREALLAAACIPRPTVARLDELELGTDIVDAETMGVVRVADGLIQFTHPLLCAAAIELATDTARRTMHERLAITSLDPEEAAHHRGMATPGPDEGVAIALSAAAESSSRRGASSTAAELASLALARTEDRTGLEVWTRKVRAAELVYTSGDASEAAALLEGLEQDCPPGAVRGRGWLTMTQVAYHTSSQHRAQECAQLALADADDDPELRANSLLSLAALTTDNADRVRYSGEAKRCLEQSGVDDNSLLAWALCEDVSARFHAGDGLDLAAINRALAVERTGRPWSSDDQVAAVRPVLLKWADLHQDALAALAELEGRATEEGNEGILPYVLGHRASTLLRAGRYAEAAAVASEHLFQAEATGQSGQRIQALHNLAAIDAHAGRLDLAADRAREVLAWSDVEQDPWLEMSAAGVLGFVALSAEHAGDACEWFERWSRAANQEGIVDPGISRYHGDRIEALASIGEIDLATELTDQLAGLATRSGRTSAAGVTARCRGTLAAGELDSAAANDHLDESVRLLTTVDLPFESARSYFVKGIIHRRAKEKRRAREALTNAERIFRELGAETWAARTAVELSRIGSRPAASLELTATERRIADLVASGLTNRRVAEQAFVSPKTVEANLSKVYRKLGISSRAELGAYMARLSDTD